MTIDAIDKLTCILRYNLRYIRPRLVYSLGTSDTSDRKPKIQVSATGDSSAPLPDLSVLVSRFSHLPSPGEAP